jgi:hypothetical protein
MCDYDWSSGSFVFKQKLTFSSSREYVYLWYRLLEINVGTRDTAADEML